MVFGMSFDHLKDIEVVLNKLRKIKADRGRVTVYNLGNLAGSPVSDEMVDFLEGRIDLDLSKPNIVCLSNYVLQIRVVKPPKRKETKR